MSSPRENRRFCLRLSQYLACLRAEAQGKSCAVPCSISDRPGQAGGRSSGGWCRDADRRLASVGPASSGKSRRLIDAQSEVQTAGFGLKRILNLPDAEPTDLTDINLFTQTPEINFSDTVGMALDQRAELQSLSAQVDAASLEHKAAIANSFANADYERRLESTGPDLWFSSSRLRL